jgi:hypothetical protein
MNNSIILRIVLIAVVAFIAVRLVTWLLGLFVSILHTAVILAVVIGIVWILFQIFGQRKGAY